MISLQLRTLGRDSVVLVDLAWLVVLARTRRRTLTVGFCGLKIILDIRCRDHADRIWQKALARQCCPVEVVSDISLPRWT